jgi:GYD domain
VGGRLEAFYYAFGDDDFVIIADVPSNVDASALSLTANASGGVKSRITVLIAPEEVDQATKKTVNFRPPGKVERTRRHRANFSPQLLENCVQSEDCPSCPD